MYVEIITTDSGNATGALREEFDLKRFSVRVGADCPDETVTNWLTEAGAGHRTGEDVAINLQWLRQCTAERTPEWQQGFEQMLDYASTKGWMDDARTVVMAHVEKA